MSIPLRIRTGLIAAAIAIAAWNTAAQQVNSDNEDRDKIMEQLKPYKHKFLVKDLDLSKEQQRDFLPIYDKMDDELLKINEDTRRLERSVSENNDASEIEIEAASRAVFEQKQKEAQIELSYYDKFKEILSPRQLLKLKSSERRFTQWIVRHHRRLSRDRGETDNRR